jgi:hypothetical protein
MKNIARCLWDSSFPRVVRLGRETNVDVKNAWNRTSTPYIFVVVAFAVAVIGSNFKYSAIYLESDKQNGGVSCLLLPITLFNTQNVMETRLAKLY